ncbi:GATOR complex protein NPRL3-like [Myxocyprinus asiaticus]|uniref:GATOR complex protein NPRL3-like n=1 Tax=Myxocyprinus asiaticus TaxID=70543 RepID=UPI00222345D2|nr:GATOR complex protein NPRL3-like [Myxocyprinus asiaticus]
MFSCCLLQANAEASVINCMYNLSRRIAIALQHEERRCQYLTREAKLMLAVQDEVTTMTETDGTSQSPFRKILPKCKLARDLKEAYDRPYHALLLLDDEKVLLAQLSLDCSPALVCLIKTCSAVKNLQQLAQDAELALLQAQLIQMVVWMLQHRLLIQLHTYVCLLVLPIEEEPPIVTRVTGRSLSTPSALSFGSLTSSDDMTLTSPSMDDSNAELQTGGDSPLNKRKTETVLVSLSEHERQAVLRVPAAQNPENLRLFARLLHYFRGHHHLKEIMYNENMRRSQLKTLFDKFRSVLVITNHKDPIISLFQSPLE